VGAVGSVTGLSHVDDLAPTLALPRSTRGGNRRHGETLEHWHRFRAALRSAQVPSEPPFQQFLVRYEIASDSPAETPPSSDPDRTASADCPAAPPGRVFSLDALRGFDMLMILGIDEIVNQAANLLRPGAPDYVSRPLHFIANQLSHKAWAGMAFEDLIFPLFVFMVGVSTVFSLSKTRAQRTTGQVMVKIICRAALLYLLGLVVYGGLDQPIFGFPGQNLSHHAVRWLGVLQRIAICYFVASILFYFFRPRTLIASVVLLLVGYWLLMAFVPVPGVGKGSFVEGKNLANYIDQRWLGGFKWDGDHDPEGLLSTLPAIATCLLGVLSGLTLRSQRSGPYAKFAILFLGGAALAGAGYSWGFLPSPVQFPVIKKLWTSSFVLLAGGYSAMLLSLFYLVLDIWKIRLWAVPFAWIGTNAILLYMIGQFGFAVAVAQRMVGGGQYRNPIFGDAQDLITSCVALALVFALARFLYQKRLFIRV
jgi:predicted acyltransferase